MNDAFFGITLSILVLRWWWKKHAPTKVDTVPQTIKSLTTDSTPEGRTVKQEEIDELITVIIPTINNGQ